MENLEQQQQQQQSKQKNKLLNLVSICIIVAGSFTAGYYTSFKIWPWKNKTIITDLPEKYRYFTVDTVQEFNGNKAFSLYKLKFVENEIIKKDVPENFYVLAEANKFQQYDTLYMEVISKSVNDIAEKMSTQLQK